MFLKLKQAAEIGVGISPYLPVDQRGLKDAARHMEVVTGVQQLLFCLSELCHQLTIKAIDCKPLGEH